jgi:NAD(P)-dependent dehydrogenase (short-subunit alcohol dehydrogenase family)
MAFEGFNLAGKTALVTGSARGNGSSLARAGASVAVLDRPEMAQPAYAVRGEILAPASVQGSTNSMSRAPRRSPRPWTGSCRISVRWTSSSRAADRPSSNQ